MRSNAVLKVIIESFFRLADLSNPAVMLAKEYYKQTLGWKSWFVVRAGWSTQNTSTSILNCKLMLTLV